jgi:PAS domain S-box-containing protein
MVRLRGKPNVGGWNDQIDETGDPETGAGGGADTDGPVEPSTASDVITDEAAQPDPADAPMGIGPLRAMVEHLACGAAYIRDDRLWFNAVAEEITGYRPEELPTLDLWFRRLHGDRHEELREVYESDRRAGFTRRATVPIILHDVTRCELAALALRDANEQLERRVRERTASLEESIARYRAVLRSALDPIITVDADGMVQVASDSVREVFGWEPDELVGLNLSVLMPEPHRSRHRSYLDRYARTGQTGVLGQSREIEAVRRDGRRLPIELSVSRVDLPGSSRPLFTGIIKDITSRKRAEMELRLLYDLALSIGAAEDLATALTGTLERICRATGWRFGEAWIPDDQGQALADATVWRADDVRLAPFETATLGTRFARGEDLPGRVWATREAQWIDNLDDDGLLLRGPAAREAGLRAGAGVPILVGEQVVAVMVFFMAEHREEDGRLLGLVRAAVASLGPLIQRKKTQDELARHHDRLEEVVAERTRELETTHEQLRLADRLASIGTLAAGLGHDMNNVLLPLRLRLDALEAASLSSPVRVHVEAVRQSVDYLQQLTDGLHLLSLDPDDPKGATVVTDIPGWWSQVGPLLTTAVPSAASIECDLPRDLPPVMIAPHRLTQAVLNLVVNAGEAVTDRDGATIRVWAEAFEDRRFVRLSVTDNGAGMPLEVRRRALDPFFTTKTRGLGTGLGLALVHGVAQSAGGSIQIESESGHGTTMMLVLPADATATSAGDDAGGLPPSAVVSLEDGRTATLVGSLLAMSGVAVRYQERKDPGRDPIWVVDGNDELLPRVREVLDNGDRRVVAIGPASAAWLEAGALVIDDPDDFELIRRRVSQLIYSFKKATS